MQIPLRGIDERGEVRVYYHGVLPHWRQANCTYFVTYRQNDALPEAVIREFEFERNQWLSHRGIDVSQLADGKFNWSDTIGKLPVTDQRQYEKTMATKLNKYLDAGHGSCVLKRPDIRKVVADSLEFFHEQRVWSGDYVVMPNHVHVLMRPMAGFELEDILQAVKERWQPPNLGNIGLDRTFAQVTRSVSEDGAGFRLKSSLTLRVTMVESLAFFAKVRSRLET